MADVIEYVPTAKCWVLKHDNAITVMVRRTGKLNWDANYNALRCWEHISPGDICLDVGAFIGDTCAPMLERGASVIAIESQADASDCFRKNHPAVELHNVICGNGEAVGLHNGAGGNMGARGVVSGDNFITTKLDDIVGERKIRLLKIDVEGYEVHALRGASKILAQRPIVVIERNDPALATYSTTWDDVVALLPNYEFEVWQHTEARMWDYVAWPK